MHTNIMEIIIIIIEDENEKKRQRKRGSQLTTITPHRHTMPISFFFCIFFVFNSNWNKYSQNNNDNNNKRLLDNNNTEEKNVVGCRVCVYACLIYEYYSFRCIYIQHLAFLSLKKTNFHILFIDDDLKLIQFDWKKGASIQWFSFSFSLSFS